MIFDWSYAGRILPTLLQASEITLEATGLGALIALTLGLLWAILRRSTSRIISWLVAFIVEFIRSTPLLVQIYFVFYVLVLAIGYGNSGSRPPLQCILLGDLSRRHRGHRARAMGGRHRA